MRTKPIYGKMTSVKIPDELIPRIELTHRTLTELITIGVNKCLEPAPKSILRWQEEDLQDELGRTRANMSKIQDKLTEALEQLRIMQGDEPEGIIIQDSPKPNPKPKMPYRAPDPNEGEDQELY